MFKKINNPLNKKLHKCKICKQCYTSEKDKVCITCKSKEWLNIRK